MGKYPEQRSLYARYWEKATVNEVVQQVNRAKTLRRFVPQTELGLTVTNTK